MSAVLGALALAACDGGEHAPDGPPGPCWPVESTPGGQVALGTGDVIFEPMPAVLQISRSAGQSDPFLQIHARMRGMPPGDPDDIFEPTNPRTKATAAIDEVGLMLGSPCPARFGYIAASEPGAFDMIYSYRLGFGTFPIDQAFGKQARITLEVVGANGLSARDEKLVTLMAPP